MVKLTEAQINIVLDIIRTGRVELSKDSSPDHITAAAFVFDNGFFHVPLDMVAAALAGRAALEQEDRR